MTSFLAVFALTVTSPSAPPPSGVNAAPSAAYAPAFAPAPEAPAPGARPVVSVVVETAKPAPSEEVVDPFSRPQPRGALPAVEADLLDPFAAGNLAVRQAPSEPLQPSGELRDPFGR